MESNIVFMTEYLAIRYPDVFWALKLNLEAYGIKVNLIPNTRNIWSRDWMPIQVGDHFVKFVYDRYGTDFEQLTVPDESIWRRLIEPVIDSDIILDIGNVIMDFDRAIICDKVIAQNGPDVVKKLEWILQAEIIIVPIEPDDDLGHADGICKWINENTVLINEYSSCTKNAKAYIAYEKKLIKVLESHSLNYYKLPFAFDAWDWNMTEENFRKAFPEADDFNPGFGYYINFLKVDKLILAPAMGLAKDAEVRKMLKFLYPKYSIVFIDCRQLSMEGGLLACVTMDYQIGSKIDGNLKNG
jgi:hypothetical protein